jgi:anti-anti-sigma factor
VNYRISAVNGWTVVTASGNAENNEPLRVRYLFKCWLTEKKPRLIVNLKGLEQLGVWEIGLLTSFKKEIDQRSGTLRLCYLNPALAGYFQADRFTEEFEIFADLETAMQERRS